MPSPGKRLEGALEDSGRGNGSPRGDVESFEPVRDTSSVMKLPGSSC